MNSQDSDQSLRRGWLRFRLSTFLMLVAIGAWTMAIRPFCEAERVPISFQQAAEYLCPSPAKAHKPQPNVVTDGAGSWFIESYRLNDALAGPFLALAGLVCLQLAPWANRKRRRMVAAVATSAPR